MPNKNEEGYKAAKNQIDAQLKALEGYSGRPIFIPGNHDWYSEGLPGLKRQEKYIEKALDEKKVFLPENGCPLTKVEISEDIVLIIIDTEWYLLDWDKHPGINDDCEIKDRLKFFDELGGLIKKNRDKTTLLALHHPMFTYGSHGGQYSLKQSLAPKGIPLPVLGSVFNVIRRTSGGIREDQQNKMYNQLRNRIITLAQYSEKVVFLSGHEHTLQYIKEQNTPQIVSGAGAKTGATRLLGGSQFSTGQTGYAVLYVYKDGSSTVEFLPMKETKSSWPLVRKFYPLLRILKILLQKKPFQNSCQHPFMSQKKLNVLSFTRTFGRTLQQVLRNKN